MKEYLIEQQKLVKGLVYLGIVKTIDDYLSISDLEEMLSDIKLGEVVYKICVNNKYHLFTQKEIVVDGRRGKPPEKKVFFKHYE